MSPLDAPPRFQAALSEWFQTEGKTYPWRETNDPWHILISEVMLQQTQVSTVLNKNFFTKFTQRFPTPASIATTSEQEILSAWEGLGYYRRVRNLQKAAIAICELHDGIFPTDYEEILALPGIGKYTAGAVSSFAYDLPQPIVDANVARVFSRLFNYQHRVDTTTGQKQLWQWAETLLSHQQPKIYNSALMELGQQVCSNKSPQCSICVIKEFCSATEPESLPLKKAAKKPVLVDEFALFTIDNKKRILLQQEASQQRRAGMWKLPLRDHPQTETFPLLSKSNYAITHHKVTLRVFQCALENLPPAPKDVTETWHPISDLAEIPMPSPFRKVLDSLLKDHF
ncbi:MAG: A/G-specific adenine glycosylase [Akkermansiaceae bacterium]